MAAQTLSTIQGATLLIPMQASTGDPDEDFTGWVVSFMVRKDFATPAGNAVYDSSSVSLNASGYAELVIPHETTKDWKPETCIFGARVYDADGNYAYSETGIFVIHDAAYEDNF